MVKKTLILITILIAAMVLGNLQTPALAGDLAGYIFVASRRQAEITVIDSATDDVVGRIALPAIPSQVIALERGRRLAVGDAEARQVHFVDVLSGRVDRSVDVPVIPKVLHSNTTGTMLAILDPGAGSLALLPVRGGPAWPVPNVNDVNYVAFDVKGRLLAAHRSGVLVANAAGQREAELVVDPTNGAVTNVAADPGGEYAFAVQSEHGVVSVFDLRNTMRMLAALRLPVPVGGIVPSPDSQFLLIPVGGRAVASVSMWSLRETARIQGTATTSSVGLALFQSVAAIISRPERRLLLYDLRDRHEIAELRLPGTPEGGSSSPDGLKYYVALPDSGQIAAVNLVNRPTLHLIDGVGVGAWTVVPAVGINYCH